MPREALLCLFARGVVGVTESDHLRKTRLYHRRPVTVPLAHHANGGELDLLSSEQTFAATDGEATRSGGDAVGLYFASTAKLDLPGSAPTRFIGILFPNPAHKLGLTESGTAAEKEKAKKDLNKLYLVVISNTSENEDVNRKIYHWFWPSPDLMKAENTVADNTAEAMDTLESKLKAKVLTDKERIKLADNVTEFSVRLFKENGDELDAGATSTYSAPDSLEIRISVLGDGDYDAWVGLKGGPEKTETSGSAAETFRTAKQLTFTRRIHIGDRWKQEDSYDNY